MRHGLCMVVVLAVAGGAVVNSRCRAQPPVVRPGEAGPGEQGATLKYPGMETPRPALPSADPFAPVSNAAPANPVARLWNNPALPPGPGTIQSTGTRIALPPSNPTNLNKDIEITADVGPWVVFVMAYSGPKAPEMARKFVVELRGTYKLPAYVFNYGADEKQKEYERVQELKQKQMEMFKKEGLKVDMPIRVRTTRIVEQTGVLVGGFRDRAEALRTVAKMRKLKPDLDPRRVDLDVIEVQQPILDKTGKPTMQVKIEKVYDNPFLKAFPTRNPKAPQQAISNTDQVEDIEAMRKLNADDALSLFTCKKPFTLVVKQFNTQYKMTGDAPKAKGLLGVFGLGKSEGIDYAYHNAHDLAAAFRRSGLAETYVLHTKYCSFVTVGGYDRPDEPQLVAMQNLLETRFRADAYRPLDMMPRPIPMQVPR